MEMWYFEVRGSVCSSLDCLLWAYDCASQQSPEISFSDMAPPAADPETRVIQDQLLAQDDKHLMGHDEDVSVSVPGAGAEEGPGVPLTSSKSSESVGSSEKAPVSALSGIRALQGTKSKVIENSSIDGLANL